MKFVASEVDPENGRIAMCSVRPGELLDKVCIHVTVPYPRHSEAERCKKKKKKETRKGHRMQEMTVSSLPLRTKGTDSSCLHLVTASFGVWEDMHVGGGREKRRGESTRDRPFFDHPPACKWKLRD